MDLIAMVLAHRRPHLLPAIVRQVRSLAPKVRVQITMDWPSDEVRFVCEDLGRQYPDVEVLAAPFRAIAEREYFMELRSWQLDQARALGPVWVSIWDDDQLLGDPAEAAGLLAKRTSDLIYATKAYLWDDLEHVNVTLPVHRSVHFFRLYGDDQFPLDRTINAPTDVHDHPLGVVDLTVPLWDIGYLTKDERERVWRVYKRAGKIDALTMGLVNPPQLQRVIIHPTILKTLRKALHV